MTTISWDARGVRIVNGATDDALAHGLALIERLGGETYEETDMTARAKRAAAELIRRGWQINADDDDGAEKECLQCGHLMRSDSRFCQQCGTRVVGVISDDAMTDLEAAIAAALNSAA